jgi:hypothetical protein
MCRAQPPDCTAVPAWVPPEVRGIAALLLASAGGDYADEEEATAVMWRLLSDSRMRNVWNLLRSRNRRTGHPAHPVHIVEPTPKNPTVDSPTYPHPRAVTQEFALAMVFEMAVRFYCGGRIVASSELREWRQRVTNLGARLRQEISEACTLGIGTAREITALHRLAAECEASSGAPIAATVLGRASGDLRLRAYLQ